jgi:hypothetical protein
MMPYVDADIERFSKTAAIVKHLSSSFGGFSVDVRVQVYKTVVWLCHKCDLGATVLRLKLNSRRTFTIFVDSNLFQLLYILTSRFTDSSVRN